MEYMITAEIQIPIINKFQMHLNRRRFVFINLWKIVRNYFFKFKKKLDQNDLFIRKVVQPNNNNNARCYRSNEANITVFGGLFQITQKRFFK